MTQKLGNFTELVGNDVNMVHRLAKNHIKEQTGFKAYAAFTQSVMEALGLVDFQNSLTPHRETFADVGEVQMYVLDMHSVWEHLKDRVRIEVKPEEALVVREYIFPVPPSICWEYMIKPEFRQIVLGVEKVEVGNLKQGRTAVDSAYYCYHGNMETRLLILDWQPFEGYTTDSVTPIGASFSMTIKLEPIGGRTRVINLWGKARGAWFRRKLNDLLQKMIFVGQEKARRVHPFGPWFFWLSECPALRTARWTRTSGSGSFISPHGNAHNISRRSVSPCLFNIFAQPAKCAFGVTRSAPLLIAARTTRMSRK